MAWTDAARAAALAARRTRVQIRQSGIPKTWRPKSSDADPVSRKKIAELIRKARKGRVSFNVALQAGHNAAKSTAIRNALRKRR